MKKSKQTKYPWDRWMSRKTPLQLTRGVDYCCQPHSMAQQFRNAARDRGLSLSIQINEGSLTITVCGRV
jgi:hypothetical protein